MAVTKVPLPLLPITFSIATATGGYRLPLAPPVSASCLQHLG